MNSTIETILKRKSARHFTDRNVTQDELDLIIKVAFAAPSGMDLQPWEFIVITDRKTLDELAEALPYAKMLFQATAAFVVCGIPYSSNPEKGSKYWMLDCSTVSQNVMLAAESLGLGAIWTACWPYPERMEPVHNILGIPENILPLSVIPIGEPTGEDLPKDKFNPAKLHFEKW
jgi:nitroreductase